MKLVTLEKLERFYNNIVETYDAELDKTSANPIQNKAVALAIESLGAAIENLKTEFEEFKPSDILLENESVTKEKLEQAVQDAIDKINDQMSREELDQTIADILAKIEDDNGLSDRIDEINAIVSGNTEAIEKAKEKDGELAQALANAVENAGETEKKVQNIQGAIADINTAVDNLTINKDTADEQIESLWENVRANQTSVAEINDSLTTHQTALNSQASDIAKIKDDLGALDGLAEMQETIQGIDEIVESLKTQDLDAYVKKTELKDGILTTIVEAGVLDEDKTSVNFYTKAETANEISTKLASYVKDSDLSTTLAAYYTKDETPEVVKTEMLKSNILTKDADDAFVANVYTKAETADSIAESLSQYTDNVLSQYSTQAATSEAITSAVGDLNLNQYSTKTQTASAIEEAIESFDENNLKQNYYDRTATAAYVSQTLAGYETTEGLESKLAGYSTVEQTSSAISTEVAKISDDLTTNYSTTAQTAEAINTAIVSNNSNYYTKTETAEAVTSQLSTYAKSDDVDKKLEGYSSLTQTAAEIKAELYQAGLTESPESLAKVVVTPTEVTALVGDILDEEVASGNRIATVSMLNQTKDSITATVNTVNDKITAAETNIASQTANISVLRDAVGMSVTNNKLDGNKIVTAINVGDGSIAIDGKYIHVTGDTVFDENVEIKGVMTAGSINCNSGMKINSGAVTLDGNGMTVQNVNGGSMTLDSNGMNFRDSNGKVFAQLGRFAAGECKHGEYVALGWDVAPKKVLLTPYSIQSGVAGYTGSNLYTKCFADDVTKEGFMPQVYTTISGGSYATTNCAAKSLTETRSATGYDDVTQSLTSDTITTNAGATQSSISGQITFYSGYNTDHDAPVSSTNANLEVPAGATLTVTASPASSEYEVASVDIAAAAGGANGNNYYTATLGSHDNVNINMSANTDVNWNRAGFREAYIDIYEGDTLKKTVTVYNGTVAYGKKIPCITDAAYQLNETITHADGATLKVIARAVYSYKVDEYRINQGALTISSNVSGDTVVSTGYASYICLG